MKAKLDAIRKQLDKLDPAGGLCAACAAGPEWVEVICVVGQPEPEVPEPPGCLNPGQCPGQDIAQVVIKHWTVGEDDDPDDDDPLDDPLGIDTDDQDEVSSLTTTR
jgi:hypothetical protein